MNIEKKKQEDDKRDPPQGFAEFDQLVRKLAQVPKDEAVKLEKAERKRAKPKKKK